MKIGFRLSRCLTLKVLLVLLLLLLVVSCRVATQSTAVALEPINTPLEPGIIFVETKQNPTESLTQPPTSTEAPSSTPASTDASSPTTTPAQTDASTPTITLPPMNNTALDCIRLINPPNGSLLPEMGKVKFEWEPYIKAQKYLFEITKPDGNLLAFETFNTSSEQYMNLLSWEGLYTWRVVVYNLDGSEFCITEPFNFSKLKFVPSPQPENSNAFPSPKRKNKSGEGG